MANFADAISSIESGGRYDILGPVTRSGDRAYGKYQIMGANVGPWTREVLGRQMTPEEFAADPQAQDAVFQAKFGNYVSKYGPEGAARAWFAGEKGMNDPNRKDILGTSVASYANKFNKATGNAPMPIGMPQIMGGAGPDETGLPPILQQQQAGGLAGLFQDPEKFAALAMIAKGLNPWSELDPQQMLAQAQRQKLAQAQQFYERQKDQRDYALRERQANEPQLVTRPDGSIVAIPKGGAGGAPRELMPGIKPLDSTNDIKNLENINKQRVAQGLPPLRQDEWELELKKAGATKVDVNTGEKGYDTTLGRAYGETFMEHQKNARASENRKSSLTQMEQLMDRPGFYSGTGSEAVLAVKKGIAALGGDPKSAANMEAFTALANKAVMDGLGGSLGTAVSNADREFIANTVPNLSATPEGNRERIRVLKKLDERQIEVARRAREYAKKNNGRIDAGFDEELARFAEANPLFPKAESAGGAAASPATSSRFQKGMTATNPRTGERLVFDGEKWMPAQ